MEYSLYACPSIAPLVPQADDLSTPIHFTLNIALVAIAHAQLASSLELPTLYPKSEGSGMQSCAL